MATMILTKQNLADFVESLIKSGAVVGVQKKEGKFAYAPLKKAADLTLDYDVTLLPPKKYIMPQWETLIKFKVSAIGGSASGGKPEVKVEGVVESDSITIIGVHPYDLKAINQLDRLFEENHPDANYLKKRASTTIIAVTPTCASKWSFWASMDSASVDKGYDLLLTDLGGKYAVETGTPKGEALLKKYAKTDQASPDDIKKLQSVKKSVTDLCASDRKIKAAVPELKSILEKKRQSKLWEEKAEKCYSCGSCNMICPTCYCFDVKEEINLDLQGGRRYRIWDGCQLEDFAKIGSGENFREERMHRYRHRFYRKWDYLFEKLGEPACVGCGRCSSVCLPDITDPVKIFNSLKEEK